jgi:hypothetical protein
MIFSSMVKVSMAKPYLSVGMTTGKEPKFFKSGFLSEKMPFKGNSSENIKRNTKIVADKMGM